MKSSQSDIAILLVEGFLGISVFGPADLFETANRISRLKDRNYQPFRVATYSLDGSAVRSSSGVLTVPDHSIEALSDPKAIVIPGIGTESVADLDNHCQQFNGMADALKKFHDNGTIIATSCTGTFLLAQTGLLDGQRATTTWWTQAAFQAKFPSILLDAGEMLVDEGRLITAAAGTSSLDMALHLIKHFQGAAMSRLCARYLVVEEGRSSQLPYIVPWHESSRDELIERTDHWIERNMFKQRLRVEDLAEFLGKSPRSLLRHFQKHVLMSPQQYILRSLTEQAKSLMEFTQLPIAKIADDLGFSDENSFRRSFLQQVGMSPAQYRQKFRKPIAAE